MIMFNKIMIMLRWARAEEENSFSWTKKERLPELIMIPMIMMIMMIILMILIIIMIVVIILTIIMVMIIMMIAHFLEPKVSDAPTKLINDNYHNNDFFFRRLKDQRLLLNCQPQLRNLSQRKTR